jgi:predicted nucleotidyltransferase
MVETEIRTTIETFRKVLEESGIRVARIVLYGSYARGGFHEDSDIDVAVVSPDFGGDRFEEGIKLRELALRIDPRIEPVPVSVESYERDTWIPLIYEIRETGVEIDGVA